MEKKKCSMCGSRKLSERGHKLWFCNGCNNLTDCEDDGTIGYRMPETNAAKKEGFEIRQKARDKRKRASNRR